MHTMKPFTKIGFAALGVFSLSLLAISGATKPKPDPSPTVAAQDFVRLPIPSGTYVMDKTHGYVTFSYSHFGFSNPVLAFRNIDARVKLDAKKPENSQVDVLIHAESIDSGVDEFDTHLRSDDFFDVEKFPDITFKSTSLIRTGESTGTLSGDLTMKGITKPVTLDVKILGARKHPLKGVYAFGIEATGTLKRKDFDLGKYAPSVSNNVDLHISAEFHKKG